MTIARVIKRDGREVPFDETKIRDAVQRAMVAVGEGDPGFAAEVAGVVRLALENRRAGVESAAAGGQVPGIEEIQDLVEHALIELGRASVAKAYILYRDRRAQVREVLEVHRSPAPGARLPRVRPTEAGAPAPWSKGRIVAALMNEAGLARAAAEEVAARVEARVFSLGLKRISTALVRELVDSELAGLGLQAALRRQASVLLPVFDLRRQLELPARPLDSARAAAPEELADGDAARRVSGDALRRYALEHVLDDASAERHLAGDLHVLDLAEPHLYLWAGFPSALFGEQVFDERGAFSALGECARSLACVSQGIVIEDAGALLSGLARARASRRGGALASWLSSAAAIARAGGRRIELEFSGERHAEVLDRVLQALTGFESEAAAPRVFLDEPALECVAAARRGDPAQLQALERLFERGQLVPTWSREGERFAAPGCLRGERERAAVYCAGAAAVDLPRLALRVGPWREDRMLEELALLVESAAHALERLHAFQSSVRASRPDELRGRVMYALAPVGLREALQVLGDGEIRPEQGARLAGFLADVARRTGAARGLTLVATPFFGERAALRFAEQDRALPQHSQRLLFGENARLEPGRAYSFGHRLSPAPGFVPWAAEAQLASTVPVGALHPLPEDRSRGGMLSLAESALRFFRLRREPPAPLSDPRPAALRASAGFGLFDELAPRAAGLARPPVQPL